ncbi:MAG: hypothetical protein WC238_05750 [Parcubacteria group bacterium]|jgi:hypothetical protein
MRRADHTIYNLINNYARSVLKDPNHYILMKSSRNRSQFELHSDGFKLRDGKTLIGRIQYVLVPSLEVDIVLMDHINSQKSFLRSLYLILLSKGFEVNDKASEEIKPIK